MSENLLEKYLYMGMSFSTMKLNKVDLLCINYHLSRFKFNKKRYLKKIQKILSNSSELSSLQLEFTPYYVHKEIDALKNNTLFIGIDDKEEKKLKKLRKNKLEDSSEFSIEFLPDNLVDKNATFIFRTFNEMHDHSILMEKFEKTNVVVLDSLLMENQKNDSNEDLLDMMKLIILKDDGDFYFVTPDCYYTNQIINFIFSLNKIGITY
ncbi:MAG: hypothetical protein ACI4U5_00810 [Bacilli bacterium]